MFSGKPYLTLRVETELLVYRIYVNGAHLSTDLSGGPADDTLPVNQALRSGSNEISLIALPWDMGDGKIAFHEDAKAKLTLLLQQSGALDQPGIEVASLSFRGRGAGTPAVTEGSSVAGTFDSTRQLAAAANGDVQVGPPRVRQLDKDGMLLLERTITLPMPLLEWEFLRSDAVPETYTATEEELKAPYESLLSAYEVIWNALNTRNIDSIMPLFEERSRNNDRAFYLAPGTTQQKLRAAFQAALEDDSEQLAPLRPKSGSWSWDAGPTGRLMRLVHGKRGSAIIRFEDKKNPRYRTVFPITFRKKGNQYIVAL